MQLDFLKKSFEEETEHNIQNIEIRLNNLRKGIFKRHDELAKLISSLQTALNQLECQVKLISTKTAGELPAEQQQDLLDNLVKEEVGFII